MLTLQFSIKFSLKSPELNQYNQLNRYDKIYRMKCIDQISVNKIVHLISFRNEVSF